MVAKDTLANRALSNRVYFPIIYEEYFFPGLSNTGKRKMYEKMQTLFFKHRAV